MVQDFLRASNGTTPFIGQCFLSSDFIEWAQKNGGSKVLYLITNFLILNITNS